MAYDLWQRMQRQAQDPYGTLLEACRKQLGWVLDYNNKQRPEESTDEFLQQVFSTSYARALRMGEMSQHDLRAFEDFARLIKCTMGRDADLDYEAYSHQGRLALMVTDRDLVRKRALERCRHASAVFLSKWGSSVICERGIRRVIARMVWETREDDSWIRIPRGNKKR